MWIFRTYKMSLYSVYPTLLAISIVPYTAHNGAYVGWNARASLTVHLWTIRECQVHCSVSNGTFNWFQTIVFVPISVTAVWCQWWWIAPRRHLEKLESISLFAGIMENSRSIWTRTPLLRTWAVASMAIYIKWLSGSFFFLFHFNSDQPYKL